MEAKIKCVLDKYLEKHHYRKTPERYAILDAVYKMQGHFSLQELACHIEKHNFRVSRSTLYNAMRLFIQLHLVTCHKLRDGTKYEACYNYDGHCHQICTICGNVSEIHSEKIVETIGRVGNSDFKQEAFALYIYGVCQQCRQKEAMVG